MSIVCSALRFKSHLAPPALIQNKFGTSLHPHTALYSSLRDLVPAIADPALAQVGQLLDNAPQCKPVMAAVFPNGEVGIVALDETPETSAHLPSFAEVPQAPKGYVFYGPPGNLVAHPIQAILRVSTSIDFRFEGTSFSASLNIRPGADGNAGKMKINGQKAVKASHYRAF